MYTFLVKEPGKTPELRDFITDDVLTTLQELVGGYVEVVRVGPKTSVICNEDGISLGLPQNCGYLGTIVFVGEADGDWVSLSPEEVRKCQRYCELHEGHVHPGDAGVQIISGDENIERTLVRIGQSIKNEWDNL